MKNLKKVLCLVLSLLLLLSVLTACGGSAGDKADTAPAADGDTAPAADGDASAPAGEGGEDAAVPEDGVSLSMVMAAGLDNVDPRVQLLHGLHADHLPDGSGPDDLR